MGANAIPVPPKETLEELRKTKTIKEIAKIYFVHPRTVCTWLKEYGITRKKDRVIPDEKYKIARENGISRLRVYQRVRSGWSIERAITTVKLTEEETMQRCAEGRGNMEWPMYASPEQYKHAFSIGLTKKHVDNRIRYGWTVEEATTIPIIPSNKRCKGRKVYET